MSTQTYSHLRAIPLSLYSKELYQDVAHRWQGTGFGYLFLLLSVLCVPFTLLALLWTLTVTLESPYDFNYLIDQVPDIRIENGEASTSVEQPYFIRDKVSGKVVGIIDTTRPSIETAQSMKEQQAMFVLGRNDMLTQDADGGEKRIQDLPREEVLLINRDVLREMAKQTLGYLWIVPLFVVPFVVPFIFAYMAVVMFVYGLAGLVLNLVLRTGYTYIECVRLACVSTTAGLLIGLGVMLIPGVRMSNWVDFAIDMLYLFFAMWAAKQE